ncbi:microtubule-associated proteins 1A/1B light chain 3C-like, partial [Alligator sinensis]|uniref:Microtubule-associated proteins 1A/1B light chain 3C-like n=1 Tax=Alligator sinensis TaxID=38654 RepID=A0A1U8DFB6_ALLSI
PALHPCPAASRQREVAAVRAKFPNKLPVILERYPREKALPVLDRTKFLVPQELTMGQFVAIIRNRMALSAAQSFYFLVEGNRSLISASLTMAEVYARSRDPDGFLYMTYASQEVFGGAGPRLGRPSPAGAA